MATPALTGALARLKQEHDQILELFTRFDGLVGDEERVVLATSICRELAIHAEVEERAFYPVAKAAIDDERVICEARIEHQSFKHLLRSLDGTGPGDELFAPRMHVLEEYVKHHIHEEEAQIFPLVVDSGVDLEELDEMLVQMRVEVEDSILPARSDGGVVVVPTIVRPNVEGSGAPMT